MSTYFTIRFVKRIQNDFQHKVMRAEQWSRVSVSLKLK